MKKEVKKRKTVGQEAVERSLKETNSVEPYEMGKTMRAGNSGEEFLDNIHEALRLGKKKYNHNFFLVILQKKERLLPNVIRNMFLTRITCPTPNYDQTVFRFIYKDEMLELIWVIPARDIAFYLKNNPLTIGHDEKELLQYILDFEDGTLLKTAKKLNGEKL